MKNNGNIETVKDVFHEAVIVLLENIKNKTLDESKDINGFVYTIAKNKWINSLRKDQSSSKYVEHQLINKNIFSETAHEILSQKEIRVEMKSVIERLSEHCQNIIEFVLYQNKSMDEIAIELGYSSRDVAKTAHYKCKQKLKELILKSDTLKEHYL